MVDRRGLCDRIVVYDVNTARRRIVVVRTLKRIESEFNLAIHSCNTDNVLMTDHLGMGHRDAGKISLTPPEANGAHRRTPGDLSGTWRNETQLPSPLSIAQL